MGIVEEAAALQADLVELRRTLHREPEVGLHLPRTQEHVLSALDGLPLEISTGSRTTSVTAVLRGGAPTEAEPTTVLLRGDMDALPVAEATGLDYAAGNGAMHGCGHDLHTTALVGAARLRSARREALTGDVVFMFQPGEEGCDGAGVMIDEGVLTAAGRRADHAYGLHVAASTIPHGIFSTRSDTIMAASWELHVAVHGAGGHGSAPHWANDPVPAMAEMITALQTMVTRRFNVFDPVVISVCQVNAGTAINVIPDTATFGATVRSFSAESGERLGALVEPLLKSIAHAHGCEADVRLTSQYPVTVNDPDEAAFTEQVIRELHGEDRYAELPQPLSASEDFSRVLQQIPGAFVFLGACPPDADVATAPSNHSPLARFDDAVLADAAAVYAALAQSRLSLPG
jgi:hippurate hydrolase